MEIGTNLWTIAFLAVAGQGLFLAFVLFFNKNSNAQANRILGLLLLLFSLNLLENVAYWTKYLVQIPHIANSTAGFVLLYGPLFFHYVRKTLIHSSRLKPIHLLHLLPFFIFIVDMLPYYTMSAELKSKSLNSSTSYMTVWVYVKQAFIVTHLLTYTYFTFRLKKSSEVEHKPIGVFIKSFALFSLLFLLYYVLVNTIKLPVVYDYVICLAMALLIYQIGYFNLTRPEVFNPIFKKRRSEKKYVKSRLSETESIQILSKVRQLMVEEKLYLEGDLRIPKVAEKVQTSTNNISQVINEQTGLTFLEFINEYRVEEAKRLLKNGNGDKLTLIGIAYDAGFNNKTSFNKFFKKYTGLTPREFRQKVSSTSMA